MKLPNNHRLLSLFLFSTLLLLLSAPPISWSFLLVPWMISIWALESRTGPARFVLVGQLQQALQFILLFGWLYQISAPAFILTFSLYLIFTALFDIGLKLTKDKLPVIFLRLLLIERLPVIPAIFLPGYWVYNQPFLIGSAAIWGTLGVSFALWSVSWLIYQKRADKALILVVLLIILRPPLSPRAPEITAVLVQPRTNASVSDCLRLSRHYPGRPDLFIWPETSINSSLRSDWQLSKIIGTFVKKNKVALLLGNTDEYLFSGKYQEVYNSALLISAHGQVRGIHHKNKLLPLMELANHQLGLPFFLRNNISGGSYLSGQSINSLKFKDYRLGVFICYEVFFPKLIKTISRDSDLMVNIASDGWNQSHTAHLINFIPNVLRAVENNRWLLRVSDTGYTAIISNRGEITSKLELFTEGVLEFNPVALPAP